MQWKFVSQNSDGLEITVIFIFEGRILQSTNIHMHILMLSYFNCCTIVKKSANINRHEPVAIWTNWLLLYLQSSYFHHQHNNATRGRCGSSTIYFGAPHRHPLCWCCAVVVWVSVDAGDYVCGFLFMCIPSSNPSEVITQVMQKTLMVVTAERKSYWNIV